MHLTFRNWTPSVIPEHPGLGITLQYQMIWNGLESQANIRKNTEEDCQVASTDPTVLDTPLSLFTSTILYKK